jgi:hypothetical protein
LATGSTITKSLSEKLSNDFIVLQSSSGEEEGDEWYGAPVETDDDA